MEQQRKGFNRLAAIYDFLLLIPPGNSFIKSQERLLPFLDKKENCLIIGGGTGTFLKSLLQTKKAQSIVYLDISESMIAQARRKTQDLNNLAMVEFRRGSQDAINENEKFNLIITNFFLDLFNQHELNKWISFIHHHLADDGLFYFTDLQKTPVRSFTSFLQNIYIKVLYFFFRKTTSISGKTLVDLRTEIMNHGFETLHENGLGKELFYSAIFKKRS